MNKRPQFKYLVISYDGDQQRTYLDYVLAESQQLAEEWIADRRQEAIPVLARNLVGLRGEVADLAKMTHDDVRQWMADIEAENAPSTYEV